MGESAQTTRMQALLVRLHTGDERARGELIQHTLERCRLLAQRMFRRQADLRAALRGKVPKV